MITIKNLYKSFGPNQVLKGVDLDISSGGIFAILGPNGSGKTTLIKSLLGLVHPDKGEIYLEGKKIHREWLYRQHIAYLPQIARFPENLKVKELISMVKDIRQQQAVYEAEIIEGFELEEFLDKTLRSLSGGTRQKVNILLSLMFDNPVIILDEPTVGLDPVAMIRLKEMILREREAGKTIILTTHIMSLVETLADEIVFLLEGHIHFRGSLQELVRQSGEVDLEHAIAQMLLKKKESILMMND
ncbi:Cu-processing system ATP-binding protein [Catalinimonas alkaloidigena]|uniref:ABC transporter ATP-binding protein n=1 Tax=Catalinimonas alkaloidigena TaxID=1075417 RepID=UPI00240497F7|nr:ABC transporter ATP-binding protein [Catalinimonas alkaloidigena]MDF9801341.1 Cu-processing system ATP-binding protein [Catalinimonas alkaloidigena]